MSKTGLGQESKRITIKQFGVGETSKAKRFQKFQGACHLLMGVELWVDSSRNPYQEQGKSRSGLSWQSACLEFQKPWVLVTASYTLGVAVHACNLSTPELEAGGSKGQGHPWLHRELKASP